MAAFKKSATQTCGILRNYLKKEDSQRICLEEIGRFYSRFRRSGNEGFQKTIQNVIHFLYEKDILSENAILDWFDDLEDKVTQKYVAKLVEWLQQDSSDEEESEEEEEGSSEEDD